MALLFGGCELFTDETGFAPEYVVESYQVVGEPLQSIRLSRTASVDDTYDFTALAVRDADVRVELLAEGGGVEAAFPYAEDPNRLGVYLSADTQATLLPLRTYRMTAELSGGDVLTAETLTPGDVQLENATLDTLVYQSDNQLELTALLPAYPSRQNIFIFTAEALGVIDEDRLVPFAAAVLDDDDELENLRIADSPPINESNYDVDPDGRITIAVPWLIFTFYGDNRLAASALDDNLFDFIRSQSIQEGGSGLSPGEITNIVDYVEGGTGVFGSLARFTHDVHLLPRVEE
ncbi:MAG: DUF4249 family protein [Rhodothermales bacterium]